MLPILIDVQDKHVLVVGGGTVGQRKAQAFRNEGALVTIWDLLDSIPIYSEPQRVEDALKPFQIIVLATPDKDYNAWLMAHAKRLKLWCNRADDGLSGDFQTLAQVRRGPMVIAIGTQGQVPGLSKALANAIDSRLPADLEQDLLRLIALRKSLVASKGVSKSNEDIEEVEDVKSVQAIKVSLAKEIDNLVAYVTDKWPIKP